MDTNMTIRMEAGLKKSLDKLAKATGRSRAFLAQDALRQYLEEQAWQVAEIKQAIKEADAGEFATDAEVNAVRAKWGVNAR
jgi:RHH-type transcriptional regulator, rel operon repressor / antitoxin RelB